MRGWVSAAMAVLVALGAAYAATQEPMAASTLPSPPLLPGEVLIKTANGCGQVWIDNPAWSAQGNNDERALATKTAWSGVCTNGLMTGTQRYSTQVLAGVRREYTAEFVYGRKVHEAEITYGSNPWVGANASDYVRGQVVAQTPLDFNFVNPDWSALKSNFRWYVRDADGTVQIDVEWYRCEAIPADTRGLPRCHPERDDNIPVAAISRNGSYEFRICPDLKSLLGCEKVIQADLPALASRIEKAREAAAAWKAKIEALNRNFADDYARAKAAIAAAREREARQAEAQFQSSLRTMNAGQLFAKADEYRQAGDMDKARHTLRALVSRFPNSPLAATAAQQLSGMSASQVVGGSGMPSEPPGGGSGSSSREICRAQLAQDETTVRGDNVTVDAQGRAPGMLLSLQYAMYVTQRRLNVLDRYCKGYPEYAMRPGVQRAYDTARTGCRGVSSLSDCPGPVAPPRR